MSRIVHWIEISTMKKRAMIKHNKNNSEIKNNDSSNNNNKSITNNNFNINYMIIWATTTTKTKTTASATTITKATTTATALIKMFLFFPRESEAFSVLSKSSAYFGWAEWFGNWTVTSSTARPCSSSSSASTCSSLTGSHASGNFTNFAGDCVLSWHVDSGNEPFLIQSVSRI